jgi:hypothetical protein
LGAGHFDDVYSELVSNVGQLIDNETPSFEAIAVVAAGVRLSDFAILVTPAFAFAIVFNCRTSSLVHSRRIIFLALAIFAPGCFHGEVSIKRAAADNLIKKAIRKYRRIQHAKGLEFEGEWSFDFSLKSCAS